MNGIKWIVALILCLVGQQDINATTVITEIDSGGMTISVPGTYVFGNNITWNPSGDGQAILITANEVTLDLQGFTLESVTTAFNTTGILALAAGDLVIENGTVANMGLCGVHCEACDNVLVENIVVNGLNLNNIVTYTVPTGILITLSANAAINQCTVKNIAVQTGSTAAIQLSETVASTVSNCTIQNLLNRDGACTGIGHLLCDVAVVKSCKISNITSQFIENLNTEGHTAIGIIPVLSTNLRIQDCSVSNVTGCCDDAHGMSIFECTNVVVQSCKVKNVLDGVGSAHSGAKATGIEVYSSNVEVIRCSANNITAINPQSKQASGFSCAQCENVQFVKCHAEDVNVFDENGNQEPVLGYGTGFGWAPDPRPEFVKPAINVLYKHCSAKRCQVGFDSWFHINSVWDHAHSRYNGIAILDLNDTAQRTLSCNPCSECGCEDAGCYPDPLTVTITNVAQNNKFLHTKTKY